MSKSVLKENVAAQKVLEYVPQKFEIKAAAPAKAYLDGRKAKSNDFRMSDVIRIQSGVQKIEASQVEDDVERKVLERLKEVQETAYQEAYQLGLDEGRQQAYQQASQELNSKLEQFDVLLKIIGSLKQELMVHNEAHLIQLVFQMAKRLAHREVQADPKVVTDVMREAIDKAQVEEEVVVQVSPQQLEFLESLKKETGRDVEFIKKVKLEPVETITPGGCIIKTNYGQIDARFEERVQKLWEGLTENLPSVKDTTGKS